LLLIAAAVYFKGVFIHLLLGTVAVSTEKSSKKSFDDRAQKSSKSLKRVRKVRTAIENEIPVIKLRIL
jgi:hypothetical protein